MEENNKVEISEESEQRIAKAVAKEVRKFSIKDIGLGQIIKMALVAVILFAGYNAYNNINSRFTAFTDGLGSLVSFDSGASSHDLVLNDNGLFGYLAADFEEAILGKASQKREVVVFTQEVSDVATLVDTGLFNWSALTKTQVVTYKGDVDYYVDLTDFGNDSISYDDETKTVTLLIPHVKRKEININEKDIQFSDPEKGLLAFGDVKATPEQISKVQAEARNKMEEKLIADKVSDTADRFAKLTIWEIYSPIVKGVGKDVSLVVEFAD